jgi:hypothetical protein
MEPSTTTLYCVLCHKPVPIESAKTDANGKPVHSDCYAASLAQLRNDLEARPQQRRTDNPEKLSGRQPRV